MANTVDTILEKWRGRQWIVEGSQTHEMSIILTEFDRQRAALEEIASGLSVRNPFTIANEALGRAIQEQST